MKTEFNEIFNVEYGYDEDGNATEECKNLRIDSYACTRIGKAKQDNTVKENITNLLRNSPKIKTGCDADDECDDYELKLSDWYKKNKPNE